MNLGAVAVKQQITISEHPFTTWKPELRPTWPLVLFGNLFWGAGYLQINLLT